jgi:glycerate 2-kinase
MAPKIKNVDQLLTAGDIESKRIILEITERTLQKLDAGKRIKSIMRLDGDILNVGTKSWDLSKKKNVYMIGAGKACNHMAMAVDEILGDRLTRGFAIVKIPEDTDYYRNTEVFVGGHPIPNEEGLRACKIILDVVDNATKDDLFITLMSGGSSALMSCPVPGLTLEDEKITTDVMLKSGASIIEINAIRRHISQTNGGNLAKRIDARGADMIGISIVDVVGYPRTGDISIPCLNFTGTPIGADDTTLEDARRVIRQYDVADRLPKAVVDYIMNCGPEGETPKEFPRFTYFVLNSVPDSCFIAKEIAEKMGINALILSTYIEGESRDVGTLMASIAREIQNYGNPIQPPCVVISSGEATTKIVNNSLIKGHGGPGQEMTISFAIAAEKAPGSCLLSIDTEGTDGTTPIAGGITDSKTYMRARAKGIDLHAALRYHACYEALMQLDGGVFTGNTGTNVCDFNIMYVPKLGKED